MDLSGNINMEQRWEMQTRRLRLISDLMEDYQENMRRAMRLIGCELYVSNNLMATTGSQRVDIDDWIDNSSRTATDRYSSEVPRVRQRDDPPYSFNRMPPISQRPNFRRGFIYTQMSDLPSRETETDTGIDNAQIANSTELIQYDASMSETRCPITWEYFEPNQNVLRINACGHIFGQDALTHWFQRNSRCPVCRASVIQLESSNQQGTNPGINLQANARLNMDTGSRSTNAISQIMTGILTGLNGAINTDSGHYESEFSFDVNDLLDSYTQLIQSQNPRNANA